MMSEFAPHSSEEAALALRQASAHGRRIDLTARNLTAVAEYEAADLVISVQAGATLAGIAAATMPHNQLLALDPAVRPTTSIGAIVARDAAGPLRYAHGTPRDQVLGLEVVTGDGRILEFGGKVVKNVAGYDVVRLLVGSRGTLGFFTKIHLRLKPAPAVDRTVVVQPGSFVAAADLADGIERERLDPVALEIVSAPAWTLLARFHGNEEMVADAVRRSARLAGTYRVFDGPAEWHELLLAEAYAAVNVRLANLPSRLRETVAHATRFAERARLAHARFALHAGNGIVRVLA
ncbi:MAG: FAD-binding oxidoreductase, partial [Gemmatimonadota bacterium]